MPMVPERAVGLNQKPTVSWVSEVPLVEVLDIRWLLPPVRVRPFWYFPRAQDGELVMVPVCPPLASRARVPAPSSSFHSTTGGVQVEVSPGMQYSWAAPWGW